MKKSKKMKSVCIVIFILLNINELGQTKYDNESGNYDDFIREVKKEKAIGLVDFGEIEILPDFSPIITPSLLYILNI